MAPRLQLRDINVNLGVTPLLSGAELSISPGERVALVGRNGSGKSTLLRIAAGEIAPDSGERFVQPGLAMAYLEQAPAFENFATALDYVAAGLDENEVYRARALLEAQKGRRRCRLGRRHSGEVDLAETRHRGHGALLRSASVAARSLDEALQDALAALVEVAQAHVGLRRPRLRQRLKHRCRIGFAALRIGFFRTLQRRGALEGGSLRQE